MYGYNMVFHVFHPSSGVKFKHKLAWLPHQHRPPSKPKLWPQLTHNLVNKPGMFSHNILQCGAKWPTWSPSPEMCGPSRRATEGLGRQYWAGQAPASRRIPMNKSNNPRRERWHRYQINFKLGQFDWTFPGNSAGFHCTEHLLQIMKRWCSSWSGAESHKQRWPRWTRSCLAAPAKSDPEIKANALEDPLRMPQINAVPRCRILVRWRQVHPIKSCSCISIHSNPKHANWNIRKILNENAKTCHLLDSTFTCADLHRQFNLWLPSRPTFIWCGSSSKMSLGASNMPSLDHPRTS